MRITIDTNTDSHEDIKRAIQLLQSCLGKSEISVAPGPGMMNLFENSQSEEPETKEDPDDEAKIVPY